MGHTTFKHMAEGIVKQRRYFQPLFVEKFKEKFFDEKGKRDLYLSGTDIFEYQGVYLFEFEEDDVHTKCYELYLEIIDMLTVMLNEIKFIKFKDDELDVVVPFLREIAMMTENIYEEYTCEQDPHYKFFNPEEFIIDVLKELYKEER